MYAVRPPVTARASDSMFYPLTSCALQVDFMIMIMIIMTYDVPFEFRRSIALVSYM